MTVDKFHYSNRKNQIISKWQFRISKQLFNIWIFGHWSLFEFCILRFGIFINQRLYEQTRIKLFFRNMKIVMSHIFFIVTFLVSGNFLLSQENQYLIQTFKKHKDAVNSIKISPDGQYLLSGSSDKSIILWDIRSGNYMLIIKDNPRKVQAVEFSPDGNYFLGNSGNIIKLWKINGEYINTFKGHSTDIWSLKFAPDGKSFVSGSFDKSFRVWDFLEIRLLQTIEGHKKSVLTVTIDPDGKRIASGSLDE